MPKLVALQRFPYGGRYLNIGDDFEESEKYAEILTALGKASYVTRVETGSAETSSDDLPSLRERARASGIKVDGRWAEQRLRDEIAKAVRYQRRDMQAED